MKKVLITILVFILLMMWAPGPMAQVVKSVGGQARRAVCE